MKRRDGFVSNSSSTSFTCAICGEDVSGYDMSYEDAGMVECIHGHIMCEGHLGEDPQYVESEWEERTLSEESCPCCQGTAIPDDELLTLMVSASTYNTTKEAMAAMCEIYNTPEARRNAIELQKETNRK